jgi:co-chaperonin GroES (HSP10)|tara:strand:+ start:416 stop:682 length:267 start_codon:yes stop_codon:yes gene_type:complete
MSFKPARDYCTIMVEGDKEQTTESGIVFTERAPTGLQMAIVVGVGPLVTGVKMGEVVYWNRQSLGMYEDQIIVEESSLVARVEADETE